MQPLFVSPLFLQLFRAGTTDPRRDCYYKKHPPPLALVCFCSLSLSFVIVVIVVFFFFSLWMFFDWMRGERVCLGRCAQLIIFCIYPKERRRIVRPDLHALF